MTKRLELYRCETCGNLVQILLSGEGELVCCGKSMTLLHPHDINDEEHLDEKHVPVFIDTENNGFEIRIGEIPHPMTENHYIQFVETISPDKNHFCVQYLSPNEKPEIYIKDGGGINKALEYCNIHGLWEGYRINCKVK